MGEEQSHTTARKPAGHLFSIQHSLIGTMYRRLVFEEVAMGTAQEDDGVPQCKGRGILEYRRGLRGGGGPIRGLHLTVVIRQELEE